MASEQEKKSDSFDPVLGRVPSGLFVLTAGTGDQATGMLASWVMQAGFEPPMVSVAVKLGRYLCDWLTEGQPFVLNLIGEPHATHLKHFGRGFAPGEAAFEGVSVTLSPGGVPILTESVGHLECEPAGHVDSGDHRVFLATVVGGRLAEEVAPKVHVRRSGTHY